MKKLILVLVAAVAFCFSASAERTSVPYAGLCVTSNFADITGPGMVVGFRNYNRNSFISVGIGGEAYSYYIPSVNQFGAFAVPEIGLAIGFKGFKLYPHTGLMAGYDTKNAGFSWGGKDGLAFDFGKNFTLDFSTYVPGYRFSAATYTVGLIWRFGK